jgi:hypothetical protein
VLKDIGICCKECGDAVFYYMALAICTSVDIFHSSQLTLENSATAEAISIYKQHVYQQQIAKKNNFITLAGTNIFSSLFSIGQFRFTECFSDEACT